MAKITVATAPRHMKAAVEKFAPGWTIADCGSEMDPGLRAEWQGRKNVLVTHPLDRDTGCVLSQTFDVPADKKTTLRVVVGHDPQGDFDFIIKANGRQILRKPVCKDTVTDGHWLTEAIDLSPFAGQQVKLELVNQPTGWSYEAAYWAEVSMATD
jgi:hypothetical protein